MFGRDKTDVLIVGAGPVGLFAALALTQRGLKVRIIDQAWRSAAHSYAMGLHDRTLQLLGRYGLGQPLFDQASRARAVVFCDRDGQKAEVQLHAGDDRPGGVALLRQDALERLLAQRLRELGVKVSWNHRLASLEAHDDHVHAEIDKLDKEPRGYTVAHDEWVVQRRIKLNAGFVIGADGFRSRTRDLIGVDFEQMGPPQSFAVFEFESDYPHGYEIRVVLENGINVLWPLPNNRHRWGFELLEPDQPTIGRFKSRLPVQVGEETYPGVTPELLEQMIAERAPWFDAEIREVNWATAVRFEKRLARRMGRQRYWLAGDAAHVTGPVGVHSMNVGFDEVEQLADLLVELPAGRLSLSALEELATCCRDEWLQLMGAEGHPIPQPGFDPWIVQHRKQIVECLPASREARAALAAQLDLYLGVSKRLHV